MVDHIHLTWVHLTTIYIPNWREVWKTASVLRKSTQSNYKIDILNKKKKLIPLFLEKLEDIIGKAISRGDLSEEDCYNRKDNEQV